jgi:large subunit ribosomal protein L4
MSSAIVLNENLERSSEVALPEGFESISSQNLYLYVKSYLASLRANTARVKNRSAVRGGGKKPKAQKGSGAARWGTMRSPLFVGGGQIFGPTKRNYNQKINKKQRVLALNYALNEHANNETLFVVDSVKIESGKTKDAVAYLAKLNKKDTLIVVNEIDEKTYLSFRNLSNCYMIEASELNAYNATAYTSIVIEDAVFKNLVKEA